MKIKRRKDGSEGIVKVLEAKVTVGESKVHVMRLCEESRVDMEKVVQRGLEIIQTNAGECANAWLWSQLPWARV